MIKSDSFKMRNIIYYAAVSLDGFNAGPGVDQYLNDLKNFDTVIMGRKTYEFGYRFGLNRGQPAYPHMKHYIFSASLHFDQAAENVFVANRKLASLRT
jgi:dihydrofolate reductase